MVTRAWLLVGLCMSFAACIQTKMPGASFAGSAPPETESDRLLADTLRNHVEVLSVQIGRRHVGEYAHLARAAEYLEKTLAAMGMEVRSQSWLVDGNSVRNLEVTITGAARPKEIILLGAHYDSARKSPAADDNGSGVAAALELARSFRNVRPARTLRIVFFTNEEPPFFGTPAMGSWHYAHAARQRGDDIRAMIALDSIGRYSSEPGSQHYPAMVASMFPDRGDYIGFVTRTEDLELLHRSIDAFRRTTPVPSQGAAMPGFVEGVWYSDHWSFWQFQFPAIMVTDTAFFRYAEYHTPHDTIDRIDFLTLARVTRGLEAVVRDLAGATE